MKNNLKEYCSMDATTAVIGCLIQQPSLLRTYKITYKDFTNLFYQHIFLAIEHLYSNGAEEMSPILISDYIEDYPDQYAVFLKNGGIEALQMLEEDSELSNFQYHFELLKKFSLLREYKSNGIDVSYFFDPDDIDINVRNKKRLRLEESSVNDIILYYKSIISSISTKYQMDENVDMKKAGVGFLEQKEKWKKETAWGLGYSSAYLTTALYGIRKRRYVVKSAGTGVGKTRTAIADICYACAPKYYDKKLKKWCVNPNGTDNRCLYIGTEMELVEEIDPILVAYMADVPQDHIEFNNYVDDEEERVDMAIKILEEEGHIYEVYCPEYNFEKLEAIIESHKLKYGINHVFFDYIHTTANLVAEYAQKASRAMAIREDQVLTELSTNLKNLCRKYNISFDTCTQVSGDFKNTENRDQTIVRGAKSIIDKADVGIIAMPPSEKELKLVDYILSNNKVRNDNKLSIPTPNLVLSIYKNRGGKHNKIKIWLHINYDTMRTHDLFVTDYSYKLLKDFEKTYINEQSETIATTKAERYPIEIDEIALEEYKKKIGLEDYKVIIGNEEEQEIVEGKVYSEEDFETMW